MRIIKSKFFKHLLCVVMSLVMMATMSANAFAGSGTVKRYLKDIRFIYAEDYEEAKTLVPEGYHIMDKDLNEGAEVVFDIPNVYMIYSTTENPDEAITDIKTMNMNGGFTYSDYEEQMAEVDANIRELSMGIKDAALAFRENYKKGTYGAKAAYVTLSAFAVDEAGMNLADYFIYGDIPDDFYLRVLLNVHKDILSCILSALTMAVQGEEGSTWLDRLTKIADPEDVTDSLLWDRAAALAPLFYDFADTYSAIDHKVFENGDGEIKLPETDEDGKYTDTMPPASNTEEGASKVDFSDLGVEIFYEIAYETLKTYSFQNKTTFSYWFVDEMFSEENLFSMVSVLNDAEYAMMRLCGPLHMILSTAMSADVYNDYLAEAKNIIAEAGTCSIWAGVNTELFRSSIGITDEANRVMAETKASQELNNDGDSGLDGAIRVAGLLLSAGLISLGVGLVVTKIFAVSLAAALAVTAHSIVGIVGSIVGTVMGVVGIATGVLLVVVAIVIALVYLVIWLKGLYDEYHPDLTEIPEYMYDLVKDESGNQQFVLYEAAKSQDGKPADVNAFEGREWHAIYFSHDEAAGKPIEADVKIRFGDGRVDEGYVGLSNFGMINSENLNRYAFEDDVDGIYISYRQEKQTGDFAKGKYLSDMRLFSTNNPEKSKLELKNAGYALYNINLTPDSSVYTFIGYKTTNKKSEALTDIRLGYKLTGETGDRYYAGGSGSLTYALSGSVGPLTLCTTRISTFGTPILSDFLVLNDRNAPEGYEPVNFFSGGPAVSFNMDDSTTGYCFGLTKDVFLYFLPSVTYTSGPEYIGGFATVYDIIHPNFPNNTNGSGSVEEAVKKLGYTSMFTTSGDRESEGAIVYSLTRNPYRAIYGLSMQSSGMDGDDSNTERRHFPETLQYDGAGYTLATRYEVLPTLFDKGIWVSGSTAIKGLQDNRLYVQGVGFGGEPMTLSDIAVSDDTIAPKGFVAVTAPFAESNMAVDLSQIYNRKVYYRMGAGSRYSATRYCKMSSAYVFTRGEKYEEGTYLTNVFITSKEDILGNLDMDCSAVDGSYVYNTLGTYGAHSCIRLNLNLEEEDNLTYLGYTKNPLLDTNPRDPAARTLEKITDLMLYYMPETDKKPPDTVVKDGARYKLVSDINLFCEEDGTEEVCDRVYLYVTSNPVKGSPIIDITIDHNPILNGWETVRTQNGKALNQEMDDYWDDMWFIHIKRTDKQPKYISEIAVGWGSEEEAMAMLVSAGCEYFLDKDLNDNVGAHSDYIYLGYKRTNDPDQAIKDIRTTHDNDVPGFFIGSTYYYKVEGNLNSYTWAWSDDIFFYCTKQGTTPITSLYTSEDPVDYWTLYTSTTPVFNQHDDPSDLNDGAGGDYIYLIQTKERLANIKKHGAISSMIGEGSVIAIAVLSSAVVVAVVWIALAQKKRRTRMLEKTVEHDTDHE